MDRARQRSALVLLVALALVVSTLAPASARPRRGTDAPPRPELQTLLDAVVAAGAPGVSAFVHDEDGTWEGAAGVAHVHNNRDMGPDLRIRAGSITKLVVAAIVLQLAEEGALALDDPLEAHLPGLLPDGDAIMLRHLLQHTSGLPDPILAIIGDFWVEPSAMFRSWEPEAQVALIPETRLFPPGESWSYANPGYTLLGMVIESITGSRIDRVIRDRITRPLDLRDTWLPVHAVSLGGRYASGQSVPYDRTGQPTGPPTDATRYDPSMAWAAGALVSTPADLARLQAALFGGDLLQPDSLAELQGTVETGIPGQRYGLGMMELALPCGPAVGHIGGIFGYTTFAFSTPDAERQTVVAMTTDAITPELGAALETAFVVAFCGDALPDATPAARASAVLAR